MRDSRDERPVSGWHFWRRAFWTRPGFFLAYAVVPLVVFPFLVLAGLQAWIGDRALHEHRVCGPAVQGHCLERVTGQLIGPFYVSRSVNKSWSLRQGAREFDSFEVGPRDSDTLLAYRKIDVSALAYGGQVMVVELPHGRDVRSTLEGPRGIAQQLCLSVAALGAAAGLFRYGRKKRRTAGSWWGMGGRSPGAGDLPVVLVVMPPTFTLVLMNFGAPWWLAVIAMVPFMAYVVWSMLRRRSHELPEQVSSP